MREKRNIIHSLKEGILLSLAGLVFLFLPFSFASAATLSFSTGSGEYLVGDQFDVSVNVATGGVAMNAISGAVSFSNANLEVVSISTAGSIIPFWINSPTLSGSNILFDGMVPNPGYTGLSGTIATIRLKALVPGTTQILFASALVLANDGLATELLGNTIPKTLTIVAEEDVVEPPPPPPPPQDDGVKPPSGIPNTPRAPIITSSTHPNKDMWYANNSIEVAWKVDIGVDTVRFSVDQNPNTLPTTQLPNGQKNQTLTLGDGVWYVHVQAGSGGVWGDVSSYELKIDTQKPSGITVRQTASDETSPGMFSTNFIIETYDVPSGVEYVELSIDNSDQIKRFDVLPASFQEEGLSAGQHTIVVKAYDFAGNMTIESISFILSAFDAFGIGQMIGYGDAPISTPSLGIPMSLKLTPDVISIVSFAGFGLGFGQLAIFATGAASLADLWLVLARFVSSIVGFFRRRKSEPWGVVYDSVTKQPLDPAYVVIKKDGEQAGMAITDLDGRYGFLVSPGHYTIEANKTHYEFPSKNLAGKHRDRFYDNLYFGESIDVADTAKDIIRYNIPLDPIGFDWNEFAKKERGLFYIHSKKKTVIRVVSNIVFFLGLSFSTYVVWYQPTLLNSSLFALYVSILLFQSFWKASHPITKIMYTLAKESIPFAVIKAYLVGSNFLVRTVVADERGHFYLLTPPGEYYFTVEVKNPDGSYSKKYQTENTKLSEGVVISNVYVQDEPQKKEVKEITRRTKIRVTR